MGAVISREIAYGKKNDDDNSNNNNDDDDLYRMENTFSSRERDLDLLEQPVQYALAVLLEFPDMR